MPKASEIKKGSAIQLKGKMLLVKQVDVQSPSARGAATLYKMRFSNLLTGQKVEERFKGDDMLDSIDLVKAPVQLSYRDGNHIIFMNNEDYTQYTIDQEMVSDEMLFITEETEGLFALVVEGNPVGIELPQTVALEIVDTPPAVKGASASARTKPATTQTGLTLQVPEYISPGEMIKINTSEHAFISRL